MEKGLYSIGDIANLIVKGNFRLGETLYFRVEEEIRGRTKDFEAEVEVRRIEKDSIYVKSIRCWSDNKIIQVAHDFELVEMNSSDFNNLYRYSKFI